LVAGEDACNGWKKEYLGKYNEKDYRLQARTPAKASISA